MKTISRVLGSLVLIAVAGVANAQITAKDIYAEAAVVPLKISGGANSIKPLGARLTVGMNINTNLAVEGNYLLTASKDSYRVVERNVDVDVDVGVSGYGVYLKPKIEVANGTEIFGRVGYTSSKAKASVSNVSVTGDTVNSFSYGAGVQTEITKDWYAQADYMLYSKKDGVSVKGFGLSVGYRF
jgi:opacity protein-like surface antigen